jgi:nucleoid-associated protein YgaU
VQRVVRGDTLWGLAGRRLGDPHRWPEIFAANRDALADPDRIQPDEELRMPDRCRLAPPGAAAPRDARR